MSNATQKSHAPHPCASVGASIAGEVCAVVVTFNRQALLFECLDALLSQTRPIERIFIIDNASTDGTPAALQERGYLDRSIVRYIRLPANVGGAGGFHEGIKLAYREGYEWLWLMDDDTIVAPQSLQQLFAARERFDFTARPDLLASQIIWTDGTLHPMNGSWPKSTDAAAALAERHGVRSIRATSFVSMLFHRRFVEEFGLPIADYFIWSDDIEYTGRILRRNFGVLVPESVVLHKTVNKYTALDSQPARFYYHVRNTLWMVTRSTAWTRRERAGMIFPLLMTTGAYLKRGSFEPARLWAVCMGLFNGLLKRPLR